MAFAVLTALILIVFATAPAHAESWSSGVTSGLTSVESILDGGTYTWILKNNSSLSGDDNQVFDILVWSITPYRVNEPRTVVSPARFAFIIHVAAVLPGSGSADGTEQWTKTTKLTDATWHDKSAVKERDMSTTPEPKGFIVMAFGIAGMGLVGLRRATGKRAQAYP